MVFRVLSCVFVWGAPFFLTAARYKKGVEQEEPKGMERCPSRPSCVCSLEEPESGHYVAPIMFSGEPDIAWENAVREVTEMAKGQIVAEQEGYLHVVCRTALLRFADDVELRLDRDAKCIHVRSCSRIGYWDLGTNRRRIEKLRLRLERGPG